MEEEGGKDTCGKRQQTLADTSVTPIHPIPTITHTHTYIRTYTLPYLLTPAPISLPPPTLSTRTHHRASHHSQLFFAPKLRAPMTVHHPP